VSVHTRAAPSLNLSGELVHSRRDFIKTGVAAAGALLTSAVPALRGDERIPRAPAPLDLLILGGTGFIGPHLVRHAVARGHHVTIFTRGRHEAELPAGVVRLTGDRNGQLGALEGKRWDAVVDDSATNPDWVRQSTELLRDSAGRYLFTSSTGVYYPYLTRGVDETVAPHVEMADPKDASESFGVQKAQCEQKVLDAFRDRGLVVRPTYIVGPGDTTDRFPYWPVRLARGGEVLAPGRHDDPVAWIDVRDLAEFMLKLLEDKRSGVYNVVGPKPGSAAREFYERARGVVNPAATLTFVEDYEFLSAHGIEDSIPWVMLKGKDYGHMSIRNDRAIAAGLTFRPLAATLQDTLAWWPTVPEARRNTPRFSITPEQEAKALADWHARG
jgi:2'-hydroxyisoflavone reductase